MLTVAGAGMGGLVAAARARQLGAEVRLIEKGSRAGGSMLLSSCVTWRYRSLEEYRRECPGGDPLLQAAVIERLDEAIGWLESLGAAPIWEETGNLRTVGKRFDPRALTDLLLGKVELATSLGQVDGPLVPATGGFDARHARGRGLLLRASPWSDGAGLEHGRVRGAALTGGLEEFYGRALPGPVPEERFVAASQLYGRHAVPVDDCGRVFFECEPDWSETDLVQALARLPGGRGWYVLDARGLRERVRDRSVEELVAEAEEVRRADTVEGLGLGSIGSPKLSEPPFVAVRVHAAVTHTIGGLQVDPEARVLREDGSPVADLYACGADAGGLSNGGYASGLAGALVFGLAAAQSACA
ncbi:MAG: FAD-binding protein [Gaiellaceae bacterium]